MVELNSAEALPACLRSNPIASAEPAVYQLNSIIIGRTNFNK